jgi:hypothetical protein
MIRSLLREKARKRKFARNLKTIERPLKLEMSTEGDEKS